MWSYGQVGTNYMGAHLILKGEATSLREAWLVYHVEVASDNHGWWFATPLEGAKAAVEGLSTF